ncbi:MAG: porin [Gammaproteobacteria bacterium]|nr:porin [Gammaproteobacteria bacterium]
MNKNLIALAVGATIAAAPIVATQADVKLWGRLEVELVNLDGAEFDKLNEMGDAGGMSRFGIDGSKDLGNGLKAIGRYAFKMDPSNGSQLSARDQWVGLKGGFGAIVLGRQPTPYKMNGGVKWDPYVATFMEARRSGGMSGDALGHNGFVNDVIAYASPKFAGIKFQVGYIADENATSAGTKPGANGTVVAGGTGTWGPIDVIVGYTNYRNRAIDSLGIAGGDDIKQTKIGVRYKGNGLTAALQFEDVDNIGSIRVNGHNVTPAGQTGGKITFANLGYKFGNTLIAGNYGTTDSDTGVADVDYYAIGARYFFAKKVSAYIGWAETKTENSYKLIGTGLRYDF